VIRPLLALLITLSVLVPARAEPSETDPLLLAFEPSLAARLTQRGRVSLDGQLRFQWSTDSPTNYGSIPEWRFGVHPSLVYFLRDNIGVGGAVGGGFTQGRTSRSELYKDRDVTVGAQAVWALPLAARWSLMLRPFVGYLRQWAYRDVDSVNDGAFRVHYTLDYLRLMLAAPFVFACAKNLGLGMGPELLVDVFLHRRSTPDQAYPRSSGGARVQLGFNVGLYASF
jgi:hypothetical protein